MREKWREDREGIEIIKSKANFNVHLESRGSFIGVH